MKTGWKWNLTAKDMISIFPLWTFHLFQHISSNCIMSIYLSADTISRACSSYQDFIDGRLLLSRHILNQWPLVVKVKTNFVNRYGISVSQMTKNIIVCRSHNPVLLSPCMTCYRILTDATSGAETAYPSAAPTFTPVVSEARDFLPLCSIDWQLPVSI